MKRAQFIFLSIIGMGLLAFIPKEDDPIDKLVSSLQKWTESNPQEKVYLHMDKPYYAVGDTIWFKAYVTIGSRHQLSAMSGALYVDLVNEKDSLLNTLKLPVTAGMAMGDFTLGDEYKSGNYRIRAYTQWMRNAGADYFFDHTFAVGDLLSTSGSEEDLKGNTPAKNKEKANKEKARNKAGEGKAAVVPLSQSDVQFFPEGGNLVNGLSSRVAFKAVSPDGLGTAVKGTVTDDTGTEVASLESLHAGMGVFNLTPLAGKTYRAKLIFSDGSGRTLELPKATDQGYVLSVYQPGADSLLIRINTSAGLLSTGGNALSLNLVVQSSGEVMAASKIAISRPLTSVWLDKKGFPTGITQFTLFSSSGEPLNERIVFIRNKDRMDLKVSTSKTNYKGREKVEVALESKDGEGKAVAGNFSVSVIDEDKVPFEDNNGSTIFSNLLLGSDLKGYIEKPNYYFSKGTEKQQTEETEKALDNLMLTQGYRRFEWKEILKQASGQENIQMPVKQPLYKAEQLGTEISGRVLTLSGKPVDKGSVILMSLKVSFMDQVKTGPDGRFKFAPVMLTDSLKFAVQARTEKNGKKVEIILDSVAAQPVTKNKNKADYISGITDSIKGYLDNIRKQDEQLEKMGKLSRVHRLREVKIKARKLKDQNMTPQGIFHIPEGHADRTYIMEKSNFANLGLSLQGKLGNVNFLPYPKIPSPYFPTVQYYPYFRNTPMLIFLDGTRVEQPEQISDIFDMGALDPADVIKVDVVTSNQALMNMFSTKSGPTAGIFIYTRRGYTRKSYIPSIVNIKPKGFNKAREFYSPHYDNPDTVNLLPDLRSTIYWNADIKTGTDGKTIFSFFNADGPGNYKVIVEGINAKGELGRNVFSYTCRK